MITLIIGDRYKTSWQLQPSMSFMLLSINGSTCVLGTKRKTFTTTTSSLRMI